MNSNSRIAVAAAVLAAVAGSAFAQARGDFDQPLRTDRGARTAPRAAEAQPRTQSNTLTMRQIDGQNEYEVRIIDGEVSASINGKPVPENRIRRHADRIELLDESGRIIKTIHASVPDRPVAPRAPGRAAPPAPPAPSPRAGGGAGGIRQVVPPSPPAALTAPVPRVMLGVHMEEPSDSLREQLDLGEGEGVVVRVIEGLPAHNAGLRNSDVIVGFDGEKPVNAGRIREILREKNPGDKVEVAVIRRGQMRTFTLALGEYNPEALGAGMQATLRPAERAEIDARAMEEMARNMLRENQVFRERLGHGRGAEGMPPAVIWGPGGEDRQMRFYMPGGPDTRRLEELEQRLVETNERLEELTRKLEALHRQLERSRN
jgi:hypothetical protein